MATNFNITDGLPGPTDVGLIVHGAADHQEDDVSNFQGGAVDRAVKIFNVNLSQNVPITFISSSGLDVSQIYLVEGISPENIIITEQVRLSGTNNVDTSETFIKLYSITKQSGPILDGVVTVTSPTSTIGTLTDADSGGFSTEITQLRSLLARATTNPTKKKIFYEKFFITNGTPETISTLVIEEFIDPTGSASLAFDIEFNENSTSTNRLVRPGDVPIEEWFQLPKSITDFKSCDSIGVWLQVLAPRGSLIIDKPYIIRMTVDGEVSYITLLQPKASARVLETVATTRYDHPLGGGNPTRFIELVGGRFVPIMFYPPDPSTFRDEFYYNARLNRLYKKIGSKPSPVWKIVR